MRYALGKAALIALGIFAFTALPARADEALLGTTSAPGMAHPAAPALAFCSTSNPCGPAVYGPSSSFSLASGGCGLRNRGDCTIDISGVKAPALAAFVFWSIILPSNMSTSDPRVSTVFISHGELGANIQGNLIGAGADPCWLTNSTSTPIAVYFAFFINGNPLLSIFNDESSPSGGNGSYHVFLQPGGSGLTSGADPWVASATPPLAEGVSIVLVGTGTQKIAVWGGPGFSGATFAGGTQAYALAFNPSPNPTGGSADLVSIFADGQRGFSYTFTAASSKAMFVNGVNVAGLNSPNNPDSGLNGDSANPLPQLWDSTEVDIGSMGALAGTPSIMSITVGGSANNDCITPVAHALAYN
jgi:hypothetical protein